MKLLSIMEEKCVRSICWAAPAPLALQFAMKESMDLIARDTFVRELY